MRLLDSLLTKFGLRNHSTQRNPIKVFLLDDDGRRHHWFANRFKGDFVHMAKNVEQAEKLLSENSYDAIFLDHDLHPEHYSSQDHDDERTGYAVAVWLAENPKLQPGSTIMVHTRNADGAMRMVELMRRAGRNAEYVPFPMLAERIKHYWKR
jgi:CheY-like chemotaxis protein